MLYLSPSQIIHKIKGTGNGRSLEKEKERSFTENTTLLLENKNPEDRAKESGVSQKTYKIQSNPLYKFGHCQPDSRSVATLSQHIYDNSKLYTWLVEYLIVFVYI